MRKKVLLESLQEQSHGLQSELEQLRSIVKKEYLDKAKQIYGPEQSNVSSIPVSSGFGGPVQTLMEPDIRLMNSLSSSQQYLVVELNKDKIHPFVY